MSMLVRAEDTYLNILRVVILAIATLAMIGTVAGLVFGGWLVFKSLEDGGQHAPPVQQVTLGDYVSEQKTASQAGGSNASANGDSSTAVTVPTAVDQAAKDVINYGNIHSLGIAESVSQMAGILNETYQGMPEQFRSSYGESLDSLTHQLVISRGQALSVDQINALLKWHADKFTAAIGEDQGGRAAKGAAGMQLLGFGAAAFLAFLLIVFVFIFVKIERNLRVLKTMNNVAGVSQ